MELWISVNCLDMCISLNDHMMSYRKETENRVFVKSRSEIVFLLLTFVFLLNIVHDIFIFFEWQGYFLSRTTYNNSLYM